MRDLRAPAVLVAALVLSGCGFHPLYAVPGAARGSMKQDLGSIYVEPVPDRLGYDLRNTVIDLIDGRAEPAGATYSLRMTLGLKNEPIGVQSQIVGSGATAITQTVITRYNDTLTVSYDLIDRNTNTVDCAWYRDGFVVLQRSGIALRHIGGSAGCRPARRR